MNVKEKPSVFIFFLGVVNHWVALIAHKPSVSSEEKITKDRCQTKLYLMDSVNYVHFDRPSH